MMAVSEPCDRHAYLLLCHKHSSQLIRLLKTVDDERNDIYIHMDRKEKGYSAEELRNAVSKARIYFTKRITVTWGGFSIVKATLILLSKAIKNGKYTYFHLLSGQDLPIKKQDYIHDFCHKNPRMEYIKVNSNFANNTKKHESIAYYHIFQEWARRGRLFSGFFSWVEKLSLQIQRKLKVDRIRGKEECFYQGSQWFSITEDFARYVLQQKRWIKRKMKMTNCPDEVFIQTIIMNSGFQAFQYSNMRLIDWKRGTKLHPYVFRIDDFEILRDSECFFARKFDESIDSEIIDRVTNELV